MKIYKFEGYSDDTFGEYGITNIDYDDAAQGELIQFKLKNQEGHGLLITGSYFPMHDSKGREYFSGDGWTISATTLSEDNPVDWAVQLHPCFEGYRSQMTVTVPESDVVKLELMNVI